MTRAKGSLDFFNKECVVGTALRVDRTYLGGQFACGDWVTLALGRLLAWRAVRQTEEHGHIH